MSFPEQPCEHCPRVARGLSLPCLAQTQRSPRLCEHARRGTLGILALLSGDTESRDRRQAEVRGEAAKRTGGGCGCGGQNQA